ncbi:hypothetical protein [Spirosoma montaniterrae]|nr:hypothetical protein [Spirosoma montaniterrae]
MTEGRTDMLIFMRMTTECLIADEPEEAPAGGGHAHPGGGMGGMM